MEKSCSTCDMPINGKSISALGKFYHPDHFLCGVCQKPIVESTFHQKDGKPLCSRDFEATCPKCSFCEMPITDKVIKAMGKEWHDEHFVCKLCDQKLSGQEFHEKDGSPICQKCFIGKVADRCKSCGEAIHSMAVIALESKWHPDCFRCQKCSRAITSTSFKVEQGNPICEQC